MTGKEYTNYLNNRKWKSNKRTKKFIMAGLPFWIIAVIILISGLMILDILTPPQPGLQFDYKIIAGFPIYSFIPSFLFICIGLAWLLHGFGFIIIRR